MARPEKEITWTGPVADLAIALRALRERAGQPSYRDLAAATNFSHSVLADATAGIRCPTWPVTCAFLSACGEEDDTAWRPLWEKASKSRKSASRPAGPRTARRTVPAGPIQGTGLHGRTAPCRVTPAPDPWQARTAAEYVYQLRALRAWGGKPNLAAVTRAGIELGLLRDSGDPRWAGNPLPSSTLYDALHPNRVTLPKLEIAQMIAHACHADVEAWTAAWQAITMQEFQEQNPPLFAGDDNQKSGQTGARPIRLVG